MKKPGSLLILIMLISGLVITAGASTVTLKSELLSLPQLGKGWLVASASNPEVPGCTATVLPSKALAEASVGFNYGSLKGFPLVDEVVAEYKNVDNAFDTLTSGLSGCTHGTGSKNGKSFTSAVSKMSYATFGDESAAFHGTITAAGLSAVVDILVVRKGDVLVELQEGNDSGSVSASSFQSLAKAALHDLSRS
jgi:hypothetical protein